MPSLKGKDVLDADWWGEGAGHASLNCFLFSRMGKFCKKMEGSKDVISYDQLIFTRLVEVYSVW